MGQKSDFLKLGLIAYADNTGLGSQTKAYFDHLRPYKTLLLDRSTIKRARPFYPERFPDAFIVKGVPNFEEVKQFLAGLDVVFMAECSPTEYLLREARRLGIKTVIAPNWEYMQSLSRRNSVLPDLLLPATLWHYDELPDPKEYLPMPVVQEMVHKAVDIGYNFVHIAGDPIYPDRNGTEIVLKALQYITENVKVTIYCQKPDYITNIMEESVIKVPKNVQLLLLTSVTNAYEMYLDQDVLIMPRRFGGLCLPVNEALGFGMPVIMPDISPNSYWLPDNWLLPAVKIAERMFNTLIDVYDVDPKNLAKQVDKLSKNKSFYQRCSKQAEKIREEYSWQKLGPKYIETFEAMI